MRVRDVLILLSIPVLLLIGLYYLEQGPQVYHPKNTILKMHSGVNSVIVFFGDSITAGYGEDSNFVYQFRIGLKNTTAFDHTRIFNVGVPGNTMADGLARVDSDVISHSPDLVFIEFGANDLKDRVPLSEFEDNLRTTIRRIQVTTHAEIILMTLPIFDIPLVKGAEEQYNDVIRNVAKDTGVGCLDIYKAYKKEIGWNGSASQFLQEDHIHPNEKGHEIIFKQIWLTVE